MRGISSLRWMELVSSNFDYVAYDDNPSFNNGLRFPVNLGLFIAPNSKPKKDHAQSKSKRFKEFKDDSDTLNAIGNGIVPTTDRARNRSNSQEPTTTGDRVVPEERFITLARRRQ